MDPASLSFAVVGIFVTCCKGYTFFSNQNSAPSDVQDAARQVAVEFSFLKAWGTFYRLDPKLPKQPNAENLKATLTNPHVKNGVFNTLCMVSNIFTDVSRLDKDYGIICSFQMKGDRVSITYFPSVHTWNARLLRHFTSDTPVGFECITYGPFTYALQSPRVPRDVRDFLDGRNHLSRREIGESAKAYDKGVAVKTSECKISHLKKCRWSIRDKSRTEALIAKLRRCNEDLVRLCQFEPAAPINRTLAASVLPNYTKVEDLHTIADVAEQSAKDKTSPTASGRERLAEMARFKARLLTPSKSADKSRTYWRLLDQRDYDVLSESHYYSMGTSTQNQEPVFVEWQSYLGIDGWADKSSEEQIIRLDGFLSIPNRPREFLGLDLHWTFQRLSKCSIRNGVQAPSSPTQYSEPKADGEPQGI